MQILMIANHLGIQSGVQRYVQNLLLHLNTARYRVTLLAEPCPPGQASTEEALRVAGVRVLTIQPGKKQRLAAICRHLRAEHGYDILHLHTASKVDALTCVAMRLLCPRAKLIVHSHIVYPPMTLTWRVAHGLYQLTAHWFLGCGVAAGRFVFGDRIDRRPNFSVACNAVDASRFFPDAEARARLRGQYGVAATERLCGFVGRFNHQKNLLFLLDIFDEMYKTDKNWKLLLVGGGEDQAKVDAKIAALGLGERVILAGVRDDVPAQMSAMDLFLLPSNFEGSPITLVEAQACGVPCLASTNVPDDGAVTDLVRFLPLNAPLAKWAGAANELAVGGEHKDHWQALAAAGYEQNAAAARMEALYDTLAGGKV